MDSRTTEWAEHTGMGRTYKNGQNIQVELRKDKHLESSRRKPRRKHAHKGQGEVRDFCTCETESVFGASSIIKIAQAQT
jgi:hypothetical protein